MSLTAGVLLPILTDKILERFKLTRVLFLGKTINLNLVIMLFKKESLLSVKNNRNVIFLCFSIEEVLV
jgi:hypothetical protein